MNLTNDRDEFGFSAIDKLAIDITTDFPPEDACEIQWLTREFEKSINRADNKAQILETAAELDAMRHRATPSRLVRTRPIWSALMKKAAKRAQQIG